MPPLEKFIQDHKKLVYLIVNRSKFRSKLGPEDLNELVYMGLWKVYRKFNPEKSQIQTFINLVIHHYILDIIRSKRAYARKNKTLYNSEWSYIDETDPSENFTEEEWKLVEPLYLGESFQDSAHSLGMSAAAYKRSTAKLQPKIKRRIRK